MEPLPIGPLQVCAPFRVTGFTREAIDVVVVTLEKDGAIGRGEAIGVRHRNEATVTMLQQIDSIRTTEKAPGFNAEKVQAPLRMVEQSTGGLYGVFAKWELYRRLTYLNKPEASLVKTSKMLKKPADTSL